MPKKRRLHEKNFGRNLRRARQEAYEDTWMRQEELAEMMGVDVRTIRKWEKGEAVASVSHLLRLPRLLDVSLDEFFS